MARQLLTENVVIAVCGGSLGLLVAGLSLRVLIGLGPQDVPRLWEAGLNWHILLFATAITLVSMVLASLAPIFNIGRVDLTIALKEGSPAAGGGKGGHSLRSLLAIGEIAVTLVLAFACGLLVGSLLRAQESDAGFDPAKILALELQLPPSRYNSDDAIRQFYASLIGKLRAEPGIVSVGAVNCPPATGGCAKGWYSISEMPQPARSDVPLSLLISVDPEYFRTLGIRLLAGRGFTDADRLGARNVAVVNEKLAHHWWSTAPQLAVGKSLKFGGPYIDGPTYEIVGVVTNVRQVSLDAEPFAEIHVAFSQSPSTAMVVMIRTAGSRAKLIPKVRHDVSLIDQGLPIQSLRPFELWMQATLEKRRFSTRLLEAFGALAIILSSIGIYGVLNYWVGLRQKEIAIRIAIGAQQSEILGWAARHSFRLMGAGILFGICGCLGVSQVLSGLVFGISAPSPATLIAAVFAIALTTALAASLPAWRATRVDAIRNLRDA